MYFLVVRVFLTATLMPLMIVKARTMSHLESNDINDIFHSQEPKNLPECAGNTICAYLQANARGINTQALCSCKGANSCHLMWDSEDGHSITQGSDQYKYCRKAPSLPVCKRGMTAYTTVSLMSKTTGQILTQDDNNHCICPQGSNYDLVDSQFDDVDDETETMSTTYVCNPLRTCGGSEACKYVTETPDTFLVNPKCRCSAETACPSSAAVQTHHKQQNRFTETTRFGNGAVTKIFCH